MAELNFNAGDYVKLRLALEEREGRILESSDSSIILLKLNSGYNIGIPRENILDSKIIKKFKDEKTEFEIKSDEKNKNLGLIITGGTIASKLDPRTGGV